LSPRLTISTLFPYTTLFRSGKDAYPISSFTWLLVPAEWNDASKCKAFTDFLNWMVDKGQTMTSALEYAPLPKNVAAKVKARIKEDRKSTRLNSSHRTISYAV